LHAELWPGIDLVYAGAGGQLKYRFLVQPGADPSRIRLAWRGAEAVSLNAAGQLEVSTPLGGFREDKPYVFQEVDGARVEVPAAYRLEGRNGFRFELGAYDPAKPLVLDPVVLVYAGFLGGSGSDFAFGIAVDGSGQAYVAGETFSSDFPAAGPDTTCNGGGDAFVAKISSSLRVKVDLKPQSNPNSINPGSRGTVSVAIFWQQHVQCGRGSPRDGVVWRGARVAVQSRGRFSGGAHGFLYPGRHPGLGVPLQRRSGECEPGGQPARQEETSRSSAQGAWRGG
jgi:hypothetical protein